MDESGAEVEQQLREHIRWQEENEAFLLGVVVGAGIVLVLTTVREVLR